MRVPNPPARPLLVFDGDCGFCRTWVARWRGRVGEHVDFEPFQAAGARFPTIQRASFRRAVQLLLPDGEVYDGAEAVFRTLALAPGDTGGRRWLAAYHGIPGARPVFEWGYRWVADHRPALTRISHFLVGPPHDPTAPIGPTLAGEIAAARRRRRALGVGAILLVGGLVGSLAWRRRSRHRLDPLDPG
jgi:predicted DCC family thiol-disulfide oxidoreductase YuxK